jgi:hypothetical protein
MVFSKFDGLFYNIESTPVIFYKKWRSPSGRSHPASPSSPHRNRGVYSTKFLTSDLNLTKIGNALIEENGVRRLK